MSDQDIIAALIVLLDLKVDTTKVAALVNVPEPTIRGRIYGKWKGMAKKMLEEAQQSGRLTADGAVDKTKLAKPGSTPRKKADTAGAKSGVLHGRVEKTPTKAKKGKPLFKNEIKAEQVATEAETGDEMML